ncbi:hypothetical protein LTR36_001848 [Oleoguttula mirabilis]|uniref:Nucleolar complex-associated protein 3 n=1 Tax=Oleoguttula mirabilis TaxID=1507867 RepID=A0AAV9JQ22_9PEZI|nr:hypothetical protein LTR36_001848 [Oleoguttula mirabilis]
MAEHTAKRRRLSPPGDGAAVPGFAKWNIEQDYENRPRKNKKDKAEKLLVKTAEGWQENERHVAVEAENDADSFLASDDEKDSGVADLEPKPEPKKARLPPKEEVRQAKEELARIAGHISENPEENVAQLGQLAQLAESENVTVKKLALGTQLAVYKDIIPGYRIRPLGKDDMNAKVSREVRNLRAFEQGLLGGYKDYVKRLGKLAQDKEMGGVAVACAATLLTSVPHFNCRNDLITLVVRKLSTRHQSADAHKCIEALEQLFREDESGHASLEAVGQLTKMIKGKNYQINEAVLNTFLHLRLLSEFAHKASTNRIDKDEDEDAQQDRKKGGKKQREFRTKRERKVLRERKEVEKEFKEADAVVSYEERDKNQAETLKLVFVAYFRILKARVQHLMGAVLEGLAKYSHLINQDFFGDILEALKDLINEAEASLELDEEDGESAVDLATQRNATRESLLCIITAFALLQGQIDVAKSANSLHLDLNFFITHLYRTLLPLALNPDIELSAKTAHLQDPNGLPLPVGKDTKVNVATTTVLLLRSLQSVLLPPTATKQVPPVRVAAFTKQLLTSSLHLPQKSAVAVLGLLGQVSKTHAKKVAALWFTEERKGDGVFDARGGEVEASNPFAATVWEGELLRLHFDPRVREGVKGVERNVVEGR